MKVGVMQPYFVPYIGYWQLMNAVDKYVVYDDVNYIKSGWINRNRILIDGQPKYLNISVLSASQNKLINEIELNSDEQYINKNIRKIQESYKRAPYFNDIYPLIEEILKCRTRNIVDYIMKSFRIITEYLNITTELILSSTLDKDCGLKGSKKILSICQLLGATEYYNAIGGKDLYLQKDFNDRGIQLKFLQTDYIYYKQFGKEFQPNLSIIDVMMFNSQEQVKELLHKYTLISA